ncbi:MAG: PAS domain-containing protein [Polyangiaceae bacterium]|nr:PAS domain-containing protein [Polyangiaceae bacterium]
MSDPEIDRTGEKQLKRIVDALPALVSFVDADQRYRFVSAEYERWFGRPADEPVGKRLEEVLGAAAYQVVKPHVERALAGFMTTYEAELPYRGIGNRWVEATYLPQRGSNGSVVGFVAFVNDISARKALEHARADDAARLRVLGDESREARSHAEQLYRFAQAVVSAERVEEVYQAALTAIEAALGANRAAVLTFDDGGVMRFRASHGLSDVYRAAVEGHSPWQPDVVDPRPIIIGDVAADPTLAKFARHFHSEAICALAFIPLVTRGRLLGKFMVYYDAPRSFASQEIETAQAIANHLASTIARFAAAAKLEETVRQNELFAAVLAHDLRNPLSAILTAATLVRPRGGNGGEGQRTEDRAVSIISSAGKRMTAMIDQLLDFTRARSGGGIEMEPHAVDLGSLLQVAVGELEVAHPEWAVHRQIRGNQRGTWDSDRLLQVISNLVGNAGQHGGSAAPIIVSLDGTDPNRVILEVSNEGTIPKEFLPGLFEPFRSARHRSERSEGLGLGLFIVREIIQAHGGKVDVSSTEGAGTTFRVDLPRHAITRPKPARSAAKPQSAPTVAAPASQHGAGDGARPSVLVVDDDRDIREALTETLQDAGFAISTATNGADAIRVLGEMESPPAAILLDLMMPVMDGYGFLDARRNEAALSAIPVIVVTAGHGIDRGRLSDAAAIIAKPIKLPLLMSTLREVAPDVAAT